MKYPKSMKDKEIRWLTASVRNRTHKKDEQKGCILSFPKKVL